ncbi:hypothetical protein CJ030_MR8G027519 [Morella rubra]|uniref:Uncharacterized protein n=1 Tax=Morella rubra TaxID=262757 RepID=A0A6A1US54_9ROSI|nr:hypothetical protein CJ030_MR8G027519 [Morella rubra]
MGAGTSTEGGNIENESDGSMYYSGDNDAGDAEEVEATLGGGQSSLEDSTPSADGPPQWPEAEDGASGSPSPLQSETAIPTVNTSVAASVTKVVIEWPFCVMVCYVKAGCVANSVNLGQLMKRQVVCQYCGFRTAFEKVMLPH